MLIVFLLVVPILGGLFLSFIDSSKLIREVNIIYKIFKYIRIIKVYFSNILSKFILNISLSACVFDTITPLYVESSV